MKVSEKDREAVREILERLGVLGTASESEELFAVERVAAAYRRGLEDAAKGCEARADKVMADAAAIKLGARSARRTFLHDCPAWDVERFMADTMREDAAAIRKLGEDA